MSVKVQKYIANLGKSIAYSTADVLSDKFTYVNDFKNENREVFNEVYHSVKDYRTTFARLKKVITNNKFVDAARVGYDSVLYSITTGDFYAKQKENEVITKYGGELMEGMDIDDEEFDFESRDDVSEGDMVIATTVKKNSKISTALTVEAIAKTGKAQMDSNKENTMMLYVQNERLMNKLDGGIQNILGVMKDNAEQQAKVQNQMNDNLNKFMTNVDNNIAKLTAQMDELLQMQRNMYNPQKQEDTKKKPGYNDIISSNGVINLKAYAGNVKKQALSTLMDSIPGLSMLIGDGGIQGANMLAQMAANPMRELSKFAINKFLGAKFDEAAKTFNSTLENIVPDIISRLNAMGKKEDNGILGIIGKILGVKTASNESINSNAYNKGAIPFDGITKKSIVDVIPHYLRKMTSALTGTGEEVFDFSTGKWTTMKAANLALGNIQNSGVEGVMGLLKGHLQEGTGRTFESMFSSRANAKSAESSLRNLAQKIISNGSISGIKESDLDPQARIFLRSLKEIWKRDAYYDTDVSKSKAVRDQNNVDNWYITDPVTKKRIRYQGPSISGFDRQLLSIMNTFNSNIKQLNEQGGIAMTAFSENMTGDKDFNGKSYTNSIGDMDDRHIQEMPMSQALLRAKDSYGVTLYEYLRGMNMHLNEIRAYSHYLQNLPFINNNTGSNTGNPTGLPTLDIDKIKQEDSLYTKKEDTDKYGAKYYAALNKRAEQKAEESYKKSVEQNKLKWSKKGRNLEFVDDLYDYHSENGIGMSRIIHDYQSNAEADAITEIEKEEAKKKKEEWKKFEELFGREKTDKLKEVDKNYDADKGLIANLNKVNSLSEKLFVMGKWVTQKTNNNAIDSVTNTLVKTDQWLKNLIYGKDLDTEDQDKSLWQLMKDHWNSFFDSITKKLDGVWQQIKQNEVYKRIFGDEENEGYVGKAKKFIFGKTAYDGEIEEQGILAPFISGFKKGLHQNAKDVAKMYEEERRKLKEAANKLGITNSDEESEPSSSSSSSTTTSTSTTTTSTTPHIKYKQQDARYKTLTRQLADYKFRFEQEKRKYEKAKEKYKYIDASAQDYRDALNSYSYYNDESISPERQQQINKLARLESILEQFKKEMERAKRAMYNIASYTNHRIIQELNDVYGENIELLPVDQANLHSMYAGGVNRTGHSFPSILSAGEFLNGRGITKTGIYNIPAGGVVYNPASSSVRSQQAANERRFKANLKLNANANDNLEPINTEQNQEPLSNQLTQYDLDKISDWKALSSKEERAAFLGNMASRGLFGGIAGFLAGGPILGASIGAATTLYKSTDDFSNFIFGEATRDENGKALYDENGTPVRKDNGLISKELQKAAPRMAKLGLTGLGVGLLTPLGPLGGLLAGTALGFAKDAEIFQGSLFGDGGLLSDEKIDKLKKNWKQMGLGALAGVALLPAQPFGLIGSILIGASAGYVSTTDKFKDFMLGKENANGERVGGVRGAIKDNIVRPLQGFGHKLTDKLIDEIFGPEGPDGERNTDKGILGAIRFNVVKPLAEGAQSIFKELVNSVRDLKDFTVNTIRKIQYKMAGNDLFGRIFGVAGQVGTGILGAGGDLIRLASKPFKLLGDEGIGGKLKARRIRRGRADDMTARERQRYRGILGMAEHDEWSSADEYLSTANQEQLQALSNVLDFGEDEGDILRFRNRSYRHLGESLRNEGMSHGQSKRIIKMLKQGREKDVQKLLRLPGFAKLNQERIGKLLKEHGTNMSTAEDLFDQMNANGMTAQQYLISKGINLNIQDPRKAKYLKLMADREIDHIKAGLTDEDVKWDEEKKFWNGTESPLNPINETAKGIQDMLETIHYDLTVGRDYDKLDPDKKAEYGSKSEYIKRIKSERIKRSLAANASGDKFISGPVNNIGMISRNSIKLGDFLTNDIYNDYVPFYTGNLKDTMDPDNKWSALIDKELNHLLDVACQMFDGMAMKELCRTEAVEADLNREKLKIMHNEGKTESEAEIEAAKSLFTRHIIIKYTEDQVYECDMLYSIKSDGSTIVPAHTQPSSYDDAKHQFVEDYVKATAPSTVEESYLSASGMIGKILKYSIYLIPSKLPLPIKDLIKKNHKEIIKAVGKGIRKLGFATEMMFKEHAINENSLLQRLNNYEFELEADKEFQKHLLNYRKYKEEMDRFNSQTTGINIEGTEYEKKLEAIKAKYKQDADFLDSLTKEAGLGESFGALDQDGINAVRKLFKQKFIEYRRENRIFGRGLVGTTKKLISKIGNKLFGGIINFAKGAKKILNPYKGMKKEDAKAKIMEGFRKRFEKYWESSDKDHPSRCAFTLAKDLETGREFLKPRDKNLIKIIKDKFGDRPWDSLTSEEQKEVKDEFWVFYSNSHYDEAMSSVGHTLFKEAKNGLEAFGDWASKKVRTLGAKAAHGIIKAGKGIKNKADEIRKGMIISQAIKNGDDRLDEIAMEEYSKGFNYLSDEEKEAVCNKFFAKYGRLGASIEIAARSKLRKLISSNKFMGGAYKAVNAIKSGIRNKAQGAIDKVKKFKEDQQEKDTFIGKLFDKLDARELAKEKKLKKGKSDSKLAKIIKWLFIGGIAVPLVVGFVKDDILPAIHEKIQPWLQSAKEKLFGKKNATTDEYEGGIISGIVNPIRKYFKSKFQKVHEWFHNEGEYAAEDKGISGFWKSLSKIGQHMFELWKSGAAAVYGPLIETGAKLIGKNFIPILGKLFQGLGDYIKDVLSGKQGATQIDLGGFDSANGQSDEINTPGSSIEVSDTISDKVKLETPSSSTKLTSGSNTVSKAGNSIKTTANNNGPETITNEATGKSVTSKTDKDYYLIGTDSNGIGRYKNIHDNKIYLKKNGQYIPMSEYMQTVNEDLANSAEFQRQQALENSNAMAANYAADPNDEVAHGAAKALFKMNNTRILRSAGARVTKNGKVIADIGRVGQSAMIGSGNLMVRAADVAAAPRGLLGKVLISKPAHAINKVGQFASDVTTKAQAKMYKGIGTAGDKITGGAFTRAGEKIAAKDEAIVQKAVDKIIEKESRKEAKIAARAAKKAARAEKLAQAAAKLEDKGRLAGKIVEAMKKIKGSLTDIFKKVFKNKKAADALGKGAAGSADDLAKEAAETVTKAISESADDIAAKSAGLAGKAVAKAIPIISIVADFVLGMDDCRNLIGIISPNPSLLERVVAGILNCIPSAIMSAGELITVGTAGVGTAIAIITTVLGIVGIAVLSIDFLRDKIVGWLLNGLAKIPGIGKAAEETIKRRAEAKKVVEAHNAKNGTNLSIEEYNNLINNKSTAAKIGDSVKNVWSASFGYDSATKGQIKRNVENLQEKGESKKVNAKLATIFSSVWQFYGKDDFNLLPQYDENGKELKGKAKLNANQAKFNSVATSIVSSLNSVMMNLNNEAIHQVLSNCSNFVGPWDSKHHLKDVYKSGYDDPTTQFKVDDEHAVWPRIKAIAGICAIINEIFEPVGKRSDVTSIVVDVMIPAYFKYEERNVIGDISEVDTSQYELNTSGLDDKQSYTEEETTNNNSTEDIATNANANDKLTPLKPGSKLNELFEGMNKGFAWLIGEDSIFSKMGEYFGNLIHTAINKITGGGFSNVQQFFMGLSNKNRTTNESIDNLSLLPTDQKYWNIALDSQQPFISGLFNFVETMNRLIKAPFSLAAGSLQAGLKAVSSSGSSNTTGDSSSKGNSSIGPTENVAASTGSESKNTGLWSTIKSGLSSLWNAITGKGRGKGGTGRGGYDSDPYHIYQRDYSGSYRTSGDTEAQTIADSGCGPASAASVLRMYGMQGDMKNAVNYALGNNYKEVDGGTYPQYFNDYLNKYGIRTNDNANDQDVVNNLAQGKPVILMGQDSSNSGNTPYGSKYSHYVVARGLDSNGNVIVEDSEDENGSTRYSLADTLNNTSVRITTGYGRGANDSIAGQYISNVSSLTLSTLSKITGNAINSGKHSGSSGSTGNTGNTGNSGTTNAGGNASTNGTVGSLTPDSDVKTKCGYTQEQLESAIKAIHPEGCSADQFPKEAIAAENSHGCNALFSIAAAIQENGWDGFVGLNTTGRKKGNYNVFNIQGDNSVSHNGRWKDYGSLTEAFQGFASLVLGSGYYGSGLTTPAKIGNKYCPPNAAENAGYSPWGEAVCSVAANIEKHIGGKGRGKSLFSAMTNKFINNASKAAMKYAAINNEDSSGSTGGYNSNSTGAVDNASGSSNYSGNVSGDAKAALGKSLSMSDNYGNNFTITITQDEVDLYSMLTLDCGLSHAAACGAIGNWEQECYINQIRDTATKGVILYGGGIMQWTPGSKHTNWASSHGFGNDPWSWEANIAHAKDDILNGGNWSNPSKASPALSTEGLTPVSSFDEFKNLADPESAAVNFERVYEVSGDWNGKNKEGVVYTEDRLRDRRRRLCAKILYELIKVGSGDTNATPADSNNAGTTGTGRGRGRGRGFGRAIANRIIHRVSSLTGSGRGNTIPTDRPSLSSTTYSGGAGRGYLYGPTYSKLGRAKDDNPTPTNTKPASILNAPDHSSEVVRAVAMVIKAYEKAGIVGSGGQYSQSKTVELDFGEGDKFKARPDCTGLIDAVLEYMGYDSKSMNSDSLVSCTGIASQLGGGTGDWALINNPSISDIKLGDIVVRNGHGEIAAGVKDGTVYGWNYGSDSGMAASLKAVNLMNDGMAPFEACVKAGSAFEKKGYARIIRYGGKGRGKYGRGKFGKGGVPGAFSLFGNQSQLDNAYPGMVQETPTEKLHREQQEELERRSKLKMAGLDENLWTGGQPTSDDTTTETENNTAKRTSSGSVSSDASSLMHNLGIYTRGLMRGMFGDTYDALYGKEESQSNSNNNTGNNSNGSSGGDINGAANDPGDADGRMKALFQLFTGSGFSDNLAAGVLGNIRGESNFDPHVVEGGAQGKITDNMSHGYGLIQWTGAASRAALYNWCKKNGCDPETLDGQGKWVVAQIKGTNISDEADSSNSSMFNGQSGQGTMSYNWSLIQKRGSFSDFCSWDLEQCVKLFLECVERPANIGARLGERVKYAQDVLSKCKGGTGRAVIDRATKYGKGKFGRGGVPGSSNLWNTGDLWNPSAGETDNARAQRIFNQNNGITVDEEFEKYKEHNKFGAFSDAHNTDATTNTQTYGAMLEDPQTDKQQEEKEDAENLANGSSGSSGAKYSSEPSALMHNLGVYTRGLMRGMFGDFYDALYGKEEAQSNSDNGDSGNNGGNNNVAGDASTVFGAVPIVVKAYEAAGIDGQGSDYDQGGSKVQLTFNATNGGNSGQQQNGQDQNGQQQDQNGQTGTGRGRYGRGSGGGSFRPDCTGFCDAVIECMGYDSQGMNSNSFNSCSGIKDASGNISSDWQLIDNPSLSDVQPGDICIVYSGADHHHGEICAGTSNGTIYGWSYGSNGGMAKALAAVNAQLSGASPLDACIQAGSVINGHGFYTRLIRFVGKGGGNSGQQQNDQQQNGQDQNGQQQDQNGQTGTGRGRYSRGKKGRGTSNPKSIINNNSRSASSNRKYGSGTGRAHNSINNIAGSSNRLNRGISGANLRSSNTYYGRGGYTDPATGNYYGEPLDNAYSSNAAYNSMSNSGDLAEMLRLISTIADNSDKMQQVLEVLGTIASNTEKTNTTIASGTGRGTQSNSVPKHQKVHPGFNNGLSALRKSFEPDNTGEDIIKAVYQIARS